MASERRYTPRAPNQHNQGEAHLDALALLRLADGELVAPAARAHAGACAECGALLHAFRREGEILAGALALDAADLALLHQAALPAHVAGHASAARRGAPAERESLGSLLAMVLAAGAGYVLWTFFSPLLLAALEVARWAGATALVAGVLAGWPAGW